MTLDQLQYFLEIVAAGSMNQAAKNLHTSQPNLSTSIRALEEELGYEVLFRSPKGIELTQKGAELLDHASVIVNELSLIKNIGISHSRQKTTLSIASQYTTVALDAIDKTLETYAQNEVHFILRSSGFFGIIEEVSSGHADLGLICINKDHYELSTSLFKKQNTEFISIMEPQISLMMIADHPLSQIKPIQKSDYLAYPQVYLEASEEDRIYAILFNKFSYTDFRRRIGVQDLFSLYHFMYTQNAVSFVLSHKEISMKRMLDRYGLKVHLVVLEDSSSHMEFGYLKQIGQPLSPPAQVFIRNLTAIFK